MVESGVAVGFFGSEFVGYTSFLSGIEQTINFGSILIIVLYISFSSPPTIPLNQTAIDYYFSILQLIRFV